MPITKAKSPIWTKYFSIIKEIMFWQVLSGLNLSTGKYEEASKDQSDRNKLSRSVDERNSLLPEITTSQIGQDGLVLLRERHLLLIGPRSRLLLLGLRRPDLKGFGTGLCLDLHLHDRVGPFRNRLVRKRSHREEAGNHPQAACHRLPDERGALQHRHHRWPGTAKTYLIIFYQ